MSEQMQNLPFRRPEYDEEPDGFMRIIIFIILMLALLFLLTS